MIVHHVRIPITTLGGDTASLFDTTGLQRYRKKRNLAKTEDLPANKPDVSVVLPTNFSWGTSNGA
ncbi:MAG: hypothetical protein Tsb009_16980 [Planctomycetaceae bacterium]